MDQNTASASAVAKNLTHIIQELESAEGTTTAVGSTVSYLRREIESKRQLISNNQRFNQKLIDEVADLTEKSAQCAVDILGLVSEKISLVQQIDDIKRRVAVKRRVLENLKVKGRAITQSIDSIETFAAQHSLLVDRTPKKPLIPAVEMENWEDLSDVDLSAFVSSQ